MIGAGNDQQFHVFCSKVLEREQLATDIRYRTNSTRVENRSELVSQITAILETQDRAYWIQRLTGLGYVQVIEDNFKCLSSVYRIPFGPINNIRQTFEHPQVVARGLVVEVDHPRAGPIKLVGPAVKYNDHRMKVTRPPPYLGEHTREVMLELGYTDEAVNRLMRERVIG
jgi:succinate--hydroxymethylglutarate CoA-transferase